jgi:hypothetical protein
MKLASCSAGDFAFVVRSVNSWKIGVPVKVNFASRSLSEKEGRTVWDVEAPGGRFFYAADEDLSPLQAWQVRWDLSDELFAPYPTIWDGDAR